MLTDSDSDTSEESPIEPLSFLILHPKSSTLNRNDVDMTPSPSGPSSGLFLPTNASSPSHLSLPPQSMCGLGLSRSHEYPRWPHPAPLRKAGSAGNVYTTPSNLSLSLTSFHSGTPTSSTADLTSPTEKTPLLDNNLELILTPNTTEADNPNHTRIGDYWLVLMNILASVFPKAFRKVFIKHSKLAIPMGLSFTFSLQIFIITILMDGLSPSIAYAAAGTLISTWTNFVCTYWMSWLYGVSLDVSQKVKHWKRIDRNNNIEELTSAKAAIEITNIYSLLMALTVSIPATLLIAFGASIFVSIFGQNATVAALAQRYFNVYGFAVLPLMGRISFEQIMFGFKKTLIAALIAITSFMIGLFISIALSRGITIGTLTFPDLGPEGLAIGATIDAWIVFIAYGIVVALDKDCRQFNFFDVSWNKITHHLAILKSLLNNGFVMSSTVIMDLITPLCTGIFSGRVSTMAQAAMSYCLSVIYFAFIFIQTFGMTCGQQISRYIGSREWDKAKNAGKYGPLTVFLWLAPILVFFSAYPKALEFVPGESNAAIQHILHFLAPTMLIGTLWNTLSYNLLQQTRPLEDFWVPNLIMATGTGAMIGSAAGLGLETSAGIFGIGLSYFLGMLAIFIGLLGRLWFDWKKFGEPDMVTEAAVPEAMVNPPRSTRPSWGSFFSSHPSLPQPPSMTTVTIQDTSDDLTIIPAPQVQHGMWDRCSALFTNCTRWWARPSTQEGVYSPDDIQTFSL